MSRYANLGDCRDPVVLVSEDDLAAADRTVGGVLRQRGIDPDDVTAEEGLGLLRDLAVAAGTEAAARRQAVEGAVDSAMWRKQTAYAAEVRRLTALIDRESLGLEVPGSGAAGFGSIPVGRG